MRSADCEDEEVVKELVFRRHDFQTRTAENATGNSEATHALAPPVVQEDTQINFWAKEEARVDAAQMKLMNSFYMLLEVRLTGLLVLIAIVRVVVV